MDREIISVGSLLYKDTRRDASNSKSSSSERVKNSCRTSGGTFNPRGRARPSTVGSSGLRIIKRGGELIIPKPLLIKKLLFYGFY